VGYLRRLLRDHRPSPALVVASIALLVALGGTSVAAVNQLAANSVGTSQLKSNAVTTPKIKNSAVNASKLASNAVTSAKIASNAVTNAKIANGTIQPADLSAAAKTSGPPGAQGPQGPSGPAGAAGNNSLVAFANVNGTGASPSIRSFGGQGTTGASVASCGTGCFDVTFTGSYPNATSKDRVASFATVDTDDFDWASTSLNQSPVPTTSQIRIRVWTMSSAGLGAPNVVNRDFAVQILVP
jgi:hypothetical protein